MVCLGRNERGEGGREGGRGKEWRREGGREGRSEGSRQKSRRHEVDSQMKGGGER